MAEILPLITNLGTVISLGYKDTNLLFKVCSDVKNADNQIRWVARDVGGLITTLRYVRNTLSARKGIYTDALIDDTRKMVALAKETFRDIERLVDPSMTLRSVQWLFNRDSVIELKGRLEAFKSTLSILMQTIVLAHLLYQPQAVHCSVTTGHADEIRELVAELRNLLQSHRDVFAHMQQAQADLAKKRLENSRSKSPRASQPSEREHRRKGRCTSRDNGTQGSHGSPPPVPGNNSSLHATSSPEPAGSDPPSIYPESNQSSSASRTILQIVPCNTSSTNLPSQVNSSVVRLAKPEIPFKITGAIQALLDKYTTQGNSNRDDQRQASADLSIGNSLPTQNYHTSFEKCSLLDGRHGCLAERDTRPNQSGQTPTANVKSEVPLPSSYPQCNHVTASTCQSNELSNEQSQRSSSFEYVLPITEYGEYFWNGLVRAGGNIIWFKTDAINITSFLGRRCFCTWLLTPERAKTGPSGKTITIVSNQWIRTDILDLYRYEYVQGRDGFLFIEADLIYDQVKSMTVESWYSLNRTLKDTAQWVCDRSDSSSMRSSRASSR